MSRPARSAIVALGACAILGLAHCNSPGAREKGCNEGDALDCANLAIRYENGGGVPRDEGKAFALYQKACKGGIAWACGYEGAFYAKGRTVPVDYARAVPLLTKGCDQNGESGCYELAELYRDGHGVGVDLPRARNLFARACRASAPHGRNVHPSGHERGCDEEKALAARLGGTAK